MYLALIQASIVALLFDVILHCTLQLSLASLFLRLSLSSIPSFHPFLPLIETVLASAVSFNLSNVEVVSCYIPNSAFEARFRSFMSYLTSFDCTLPTLENPCCAFAVSLKIG